MWVNLVNHDKIKNLISDGSEISGAAVGGVMGFFAGGPVGAAAGSAGGTVLAKALNKIGSEVYDRILGHRERVRIGATTTFAINKIQEYLSKERNVRKDGFFDERCNNRSSAEEILEGVFLKSKESYQENKVKHFGYFYANLAFNSNISVEEANYLLELFERLTYRQICLLWLFKSIDNKILRQTDLKRQKISSKTWTILQEIYELIQLNLIRQVNQDGETDFFWGLGAINPSKIALTRLGLNVFDFFSLDELETDDMEGILKLLR